ncbi:MAG: 3'-5' exonuclease, partial [Pseudobdellovibrionaceae bacterium]
NSIQEKIFFALAKHSKNICVVGDDDQALYRFRGATVENFLDFQGKCKNSLKTEAIVIPLDINYRSKNQIVEVSQKLINTISWQDAKDKKVCYRITEKKIQAGRGDMSPAVFKTEASDVEYCADLIAEKCKEMLDKGIVQAPNQIAFLFNSVAPELKAVEAMRTALETQGFQIYSPRSENFLKIDEVQTMLALIIRILGLKSESDPKFNRGDWGEFQEWLSELNGIANEVIRKNKPIQTFVMNKQREIVSAITAFEKMSEWYAENDISDKDHITMPLLEKARETLKLVGPYAQRLNSKMVANIVKRSSLPAERKLTARAFATIVTSLDWGIMDLFWQMLGFAPFKDSLDQVSKGIERHAMNLSKLSHLLDRFVDHQGSIMRPRELHKGIFARKFLNSYLYGLWVTKESGIEDESVGFPKECIPFLTIHQSKGLEFPVVVIGNPKKGLGSYDPEDFVKRLSSRKHFEPADRIPEFDLIRLYYVAFTRAQNILIVPHFDESRNKVNDYISELFKIADFHLLEEIDISALSKYSEIEKERVENYSFTSDYQFFEQCPRQYMLFRYIDFTPARTQSMFFGSLVHKTIEDLHHRLIAKRTEKEAA